LNFREKKKSAASCTREKEKTRTPFAFSPTLVALYLLHHVRYTRPLHLKRFLSRFHVSSLIAP
jgi:hypothetical protein